MRRKSKRIRRRRMPMLFENIQIFTYIFSILDNFQTLTNPLRAWPSAAPCHCFRKFTQYLKLCIKLLTFPNIRHKNIKLS